MKGARQVCSCPLHLETGKGAVAPKTPPRGCGTFPRPFSAAPRIVITPTRLMLIVEYARIITRPLPPPLPLHSLAIILFSSFSSLFSFSSFFCLRPPPSCRLVSSPRPFSFAGGSHFPCFSVFVLVLPAWCLAFAASCVSVKLFLCLFVCGSLVFPSSPSSWPFLPTSERTRSHSARVRPRHWCSGRCSSTPRVAPGATPLIGAGC